VPWLMVHQVLPLVLLAGVFVSDIVTKVKSKNLVYPFMVLFSFLVVYEARTNIILNIYHPDDPRESIVYTQSDHSIKHIVEEIEAGAKFLGDEYRPPYATKNLVAVHADGWWPYSWYLRKYKVSYINNMPPKDIPFVIIPTQFEDRMKLWAKGEYTKKKIKHRVWWPYGQDILPFTYFRQKNRPTAEAWDALIRYTLYRELWGGNDPAMRPGSVNLLFYRKQPLVKPEETPAIPAGYEEPIRPLLTFATVGTFGVGESQFNEPRGIALSPDESRVYVLDSRNGRIQVFDKDFKFITLFGRPGTGIGEFATPEIVNTGNGPNGGIAVGPDGTIYATDTWGGGSGRINRYQPDGTPMNPIMPPPGVQFFFPRGLTVSKTGLLYVSDTGHNRILQFNANGAFMKILAENAIKEPVGLAAGADGKQYVCDVGSQRVIAFNPSGNYIAHWPVWGWKASEHELPWIEPYVAVDNQGNVYITDSTTNTVHKLSPDGKTAVQAGGSGTTRNQLNKPKGIAVAADGTLLIADSMNHRVLKARMPK